MQTRAATQAEVLPWLLNGIKKRQIKIQKAQGKWFTKGNRNALSK